MAVKYPELLHLRDEGSTRKTQVPRSAVWSADDPIGWISERPTTEKREKHVVVSSAARIQYRCTDGCLVGGL